MPLVLPSVPEPLTYVEFHVYARMYLNLVIFSVICLTCIQLLDHPEEPRNVEECFFLPHTVKREPNLRWWWRGE